VKKPVQKAKPKNNYIPRVKPMKKALAFDMVPVPYEHRVVNRSSIRMKRLSASVRELKTTIRECIMKGNYLPFTKQRTTWLQRVALFYWLVPFKEHSPKWVPTALAAAAHYTNHKPIYGLNRDQIGFSVQSPFGPLFRRVVSERIFPKCLLDIVCLSAYRWTSSE